MLLIGLTGSIGMGKTETAKMFAGLGVPVYDADAAVHSLYAPGGAAVGPVGAAFPSAIRNGGVDRDALSRAVLGKPEALKKLESIIHPLVRDVQLNWLLEQDEAGAAMVVLDVPLLFETGGNNAVDVVIVCSAPAEVQRARVLERPGMTPEKLDAILSKQMPDAEKRAKAHYIVETDKGLEHAFEQVKTIVEDLRGRAGNIWRRPS